jgi:WD40 repeat protein
MRFKGQGFTQVAFSADMRQMAVTSASDVSLMDVKTGASIANFLPPREAQFSTSYPEGASGICFSPDGSRLAAGSKDGLVFVWELDRIRRQLAALGLDWEPSVAADQPVVGDIEPVRVEVVARPTEVVGATHDATGPTAGDSRPALQLDGVDDFVRLPAFPLGGELTIEAWVKNRNVRANYARILDFGYGRSSNNIILGWEADSGCMLWEIYNGGSSRNLRIISPEVFPQDRWVHVAAVVKAAGEGTIYWDGSSVASGRIQVPERASRSVQYIGRSNWPGNAMFRGTLAELRIWSTARSQADIQVDMNRVLNGDEQNLIAYWRLDDGLGVIAADRAAGRRHARLQGGTWQQ